MSSWVLVLSDSSFSSKEALRAALASERLFLSGDPTSGVFAVCGVAWISSILD